jgi:hypothetical protein
VVQAFDERNQDITSLINEFLGPAQDFHNIIITPNILGLNQVNITTIDGISHEFEDDEEIVI